MAGAEGLERAAGAKPGEDQAGGFDDVQRRPVGEEAEPVDRRIREVRAVDLHGSLLSTAPAAGGAQQVEAPA